MNRIATYEEVFGTAQDLVDGGPANVPAEICLEDLLTRVEGILAVRPEVAERDVELDDLERETPALFNVLILS